MSRPGPIDSHCHLQMLDGDERSAALDAARERGVRGFLVPATKLDEVDDLLDFTHRHDDVWCALGVHPHEASLAKEEPASRDDLSSPDVNLERVDLRVNSGEHQEEADGPTSVGHRGQRQGRHGDQQGERTKCQRMYAAYE